MTERNNMDNTSVTTDNDHHCNNCIFMKKLVRMDFSKVGCLHTDYDGYACMGSLGDGEITHIVGIDPDQSMCDRWRPIF